MTSNGARQRPELDSSAEGERETYVGKRAARTRQLVLDAAFEEFRERGYHAATIDSVAQRAGVSRATVYTYFQSKRTMLIVLGGTNNEWFQALVERFAGLDKSGPGPEIARWIADFTDFMDHDQSFSLAWNEAALTDEKLRAAGSAEYLRAWRRVGEGLAGGRADEDHVALGLMVLGSFERTWFYHSKLRVPVSRERVARQMERLIVQLAAAACAS